MSTNDWTILKVLSWTAERFAKETNRKRENVKTRFSLQFDCFDCFSHWSPNPLKG